MDADWTWTGVRHYGRLAGWTFRNSADLNLCCDIADRLGPGHDDVRGRIGRPAGTQDQRTDDGTDEASDSLAVSHSVSQQESTARMRVAASTIVAD